MKTTKVKNLNKKIIGAVIILVIAVSIAIVFGIRSAKNASKKDKDDSSVILYSYNGDEKTSSINIEFKNGKVNDVILTLYFENDNIAKEVAQIYTNQNEYVGVKANGSSVVMHYNDDEISKLAKYTKSHILSEYEKDGYVKGK